MPDASSESAGFAPSGFTANGLIPERRSFRRACRLFPLQSHPDPTPILRNEFHPGRFEGRAHGRAGTVLYALSTLEPGNGVHRHIGHRRKVPDSPPHGGKSHIKLNRRHFGALLRFLLHASSIVCIVAVLRILSKRPDRVLQHPARPDHNRPIMEIGSWLVPTIPRVCLRHANRLLSRRSAAAPSCGTRLPKRQAVDDPPPQ